MRLKLGTSCLDAFLETASFVDYLRQLAVATFAHNRLQIALTDSALFNLERHAWNEPRMKPGQVDVDVIAAATDLVLHLCNGAGGW